jgi:single-strand DNA-binding protein
MSAPAVNTVTLVGNLTAEPKLRELPGGKPVCELRLAVNDQEEHPLFIDICTFGPGAKACAEHLCKGRSVAVIGRLSYREWEKDGARRSKHEVVGRVVFGGKSDDVPAGGGEGDD